MYSNTGYYPNDAIFNPPVAGDTVERADVAITEERQEFVSTPPVSPPISSAANEIPIKIVIELEVRVRKIDV